MCQILLIGLHVKKNCKLSSSQKFIKYTGPNIWNSIPIDIRNSRTLRTFKCLYKTHLLSQYAVL